MEQALIGLVGLFIGILLNEYFRRRNRVEAYSSKVFERRLEVYEGLLAAIRKAEAEISSILDNESIPQDERQKMAFVAGLKVMEYMDAHSLYLNDEITVHCGAAFVGVADILDQREANKHQEMLRHYYEMLRSAKEMVRAESGMKAIDNAFRTVSNAKHSSPVIEYYRSKTHGTRSQL